MDNALWLLSEEPVDAAGRVAPTAEEVKVLELLEDGRVRARRRNGEELVLNWGEDLFPDAQSFPDNVPLVLESDCTVDEPVLAVAAVEGGVGLREAVPYVGAEAVLELHQRCGSRSVLEPEEVAWLEEQCAT